MDLTQYGRLQFLALIWLALPLAAKADYYAAQNGQEPSVPYASWETAASNIQDAVNEAPANSTVWVGAGRYTVPPAPTNYGGATNIVFIYRPIMLCSSSSVPEATIIDGEGNNRGITWAYSSTSTNKCALDGFTISNCISLPTNVGGGLMFAVPGTWTCTVRNCVFTDNLAVSTNGAIYAFGGGVFVSYTGNFGLDISNCVFRNNRATNTVTTASGRGGGFDIYTYNGINNVYGCLIENNEAGHEGGGGGIHSRNKTIDNCIFRNNRTTVYLNAMSGGGGYFGIGTLRNCLFYHNDVPGAASGGGIFVDRAGEIFIYNCTIVSNRGGVKIRANTADDILTMDNSIVYSNSVYDISLGTTNINIINYSCFVSNAGMGVVYGSSNITNSPQFVDFAGKNYQLVPGSPCINAGTNQPWMNNAADLENRARVRYGTVDMGAYEHVYEGTLYMLR